MKILQCQNELYDQRRKKQAYHPPSRTADIMQPFTENADIGIDQQIAEKTEPAADFRLAGNNDKTRHCQDDEALPETGPPDAPVWFEPKTIKRLIKHNF